MLAVLVFLFAVAYDWCGAIYIRYASRRDASRAAAASTLTYLIGVVGLLAVTQESTWYIFPEVLGLFIGSYLGVRGVMINLCIVIFFTVLLTGPDGVEWHRRRKKQRAFPYARIMYLPSGSCREATQNHQPWE